MQHNSKTPCWLTHDELEQAEALIKLGFYYCGNEDKDEEEGLGSFLCSIQGWEFHKWTFRSAVGELVMQAICNGTLYCWDIEKLPNCETKGFFEERLKEAKTALQKVIKSQKVRVKVEAKEQPEQLSLFE